MTKRVIIIGGTGQIGRACAAAMLARGWSVTLVHRGSVPVAADLLERGANEMVVNREESAALRKAFGEGCDAVVDTVAFHTGHADQLLELSAGVEALVVISSASVYRDARGRTLDEARSYGFPEFPVPIPEMQPTVEPGDSTYSTRKRALERRLLDRVRIPTTILRPGAIYGIPSQHPREWWFVKRMLDGRRRIPLAYRGASRFHSTAAGNIASLVLAALDAPGTRVLNVADSEAKSVLEIGRILAGQMAYHGEFVPIDSDAFPPTIGATPWSIPKPMVLDTSAARALGWRSTSTYDEVAGEICSWLKDTAAMGDWRQRFPVLAGYPYDHFDYAAEDRLLHTDGRCA